MNAPCFHDYTGACECCVIRRRIEVFCRIFVLVIITDTSIYIYLFRKDLILSRYLQVYFIISTASYDCDLMTNKIHLILY